MRILVSRLSLILASITVSISAILWVATEYSLPRLTNTIAIRLVNLINAKAVLFLAIGIVIYVSTFVINYLVCKFKNYPFKDFMGSIRETSSLHQYLTRDVSSSKVMNGVVDSKNQAKKDYNCSVRASYVVFEGDSILIRIRIPSNIEAETIWLDVKEQVRLHLSQKFGNYSFRVDESNSAYFKMIGTKR